MCGSLSKKKAIFGAALIGTIIVAVIFIKLCIA